MAACDDRLILHQSTYKYMTEKYCRIMGLGAPHEYIEKSPTGFRVTVSIESKHYASYDGPCIREVTFKAYKILLQKIGFKSNLNYIQIKDLFAEWADKMDTPRPISQYFDEYDLKNHLYTWLATVTFCKKTSYARSATQKGAELIALKYLFRQLFRDDDDITNKS